MSFVLLVVAPLAWGWSSPRAQAFLKVAHPGEANAMFDRNAIGGETYAMLDRNATGVEANAMLDRNATGDICTQPPEVGRTLILMVDNRKPRKRPLTNIKEFTAWADANYYELSFAINSAYATQMGYDFKYLKLKTRADGSSCPHFAKPHWCRIVAIKYAFAILKYSRVIYLDTDAYFKNWLSLPQFLNIAQRHKVPNDYAKVATSTCTWDASVVLPNGRTRVFGCCTGIMLFKAGPAVDKILFQWWKKGTERLDFNGFQDQKTFGMKIAPMFPNEIVYVQSGKETWHKGLVGDEFPNAQGRWINHVTGTEDHKKKREPWMKKFIEERSAAILKNTKYEWELFDAFAWEYLLRP